MTVAAREFDFLAARRRLEAKIKSSAEKLTSLDDAAARVPDGAIVAFGGCLFTRTPLALVWALLRRRPRGLTIARNLMCYEGEWCLVAGAADKVVTSWLGIGLPWGLSRVMREFGESGRAVLEDWSHLGLGLRFRAAAMGVPFLPSLTMLGSDLMRVGGTRTIQDPYTGETLAAIPALFPDVALLHVSRADRFGNCQIDGYPHMDSDMARAATTVARQESAGSRIVRPSRPRMTAASMRVASAASPPSSRRSGAPRGPSGPPTSATTSSRLTIGVPSARRSACMVTAGTPAAGAQPSPA